MLLPTGLYSYTKDLLEMDACWLECPMTLLQHLRQVVTPLHWKEWDHTLGTHPDQQFQQMAERAIPRAAGERVYERDTEPKREMLVEILMEIPGFRMLTERGIPLEILEGGSSGNGGNQQTRWTHTSDTRAWPK